jgi:hypothetical protein
MARRGRNHSLAGSSLPLLMSPDPVTVSASLSLGRICRPGPGGLWRLAHVARVMHASWAHAAIRCSSQAYVSK